MTSDIISKYYSAVEKLKQYGGTKKETSIRNPFYNLLNVYAHQKDLQLVPEVSIRGTLGKTVRPDGTLKDSLRQDWGYWESKDEADDIDVEIEKKFSKGYPSDNILFEDSQVAVLIQSGQEVLRVDVNNPIELDRILHEFTGYERPEVANFRKAIELFKEDVPRVTDTLRDVIENAEKLNKVFVKARDSFFEVCKQAINPEISLRDITEMMIQHILTAEIFNTIFDESYFHRENNIAKELERVVDTFFVAEVRKKTVARIQHYYLTIKAAAAQIADHHEKQMFLKVLYETFYKSYNPKAADRLGVVYTPNEIVHFMVEGTDYLLHKHFGRQLEDHDVEILDPATGTATFVCEIIDYIRKDKLRYKYENELHANEVAILPYYIANLNIEFTYKQKMGDYVEFRNLCFVDTLDNLGFSYKGKQEGLFAISAENVERIKRQNRRRISVIIGNPPYNAKQENYNYQNPNRVYKDIDNEIRNTYVKYGTAQNQIVLHDMFVRFLRWASKRIKDDGVIAFVSNNIFLDGKAFDGFRKVTADEFNYLYAVNMKGNARTSGERRRREGGNVFNDEIRVGVAVYFLVRKRSEKGFTLFYNEIGDYVGADEKRAYLAGNGMSSLKMEHIIPDVHHNWINQSNNDFDHLLPLVDKGVKAGHSEKALFKLFSNGLKTQRDEWMYDFSKIGLANKVRFFVGVYEHTRKDPHYKAKMNIKWDDELTRYLSEGIRKAFDTRQIVQCLYRPYTVRYLYFDRNLNGRTYQWPAICRIGEVNPVIGLNGTGMDKPFAALAYNGIIDVQMMPNGQCLPLFRYADDGTRIENITDWGLRQFQGHYSEVTARSGSKAATKKQFSEDSELTNPSKGRGTQRNITKEDVFDYVYAVLHNPAYRKKYELNLKRDFPRIPFYDDFEKWAEWGRKLKKLHIEYEKAKPYPLKVITEKVAKGNRAKPKLKADKDAGVIYVDDVTRLEGIPSGAWDYKLGNRSALEWVLDQYKEKKPTDPTIAEKFNTYSFADYKKEVVELLKRVCTVSVESAKIIAEMKS